MSKWIDATFQETVGRLAKCSMTSNMRGVTCGVKFRISLPIMFALMATGRVDAQSYSDVTPAESVMPNRSISAESTQSSWSLGEAVEAVPADAEAGGEQETVGSRIPRQSKTQLPSVSSTRVNRDETTLRSILWPLALVLGLLCLAVFITKRWLAGTSLKSGQGLRILQRTYLTQKQWLAVVECGSKALLIAVNPDRVDALYCIDEAEDLARIASNRPSNLESVKNNPFSFQLDREAGRLTREQIISRAKEAGNANQDGETKGQIQTLMSRLNALRKAHESAGRP